MKRGPVVVITGASTGIGRATALQFAKSGAHLILVARQLEKLNATAHECEKLGATCEVQSLDISDSAGMLALADHVTSHYGPIEVWVNDAGVVVVGGFTDVPLEDHRRVIETNVIGTMNGSYAALKAFRRQGRGTLINVASVSSTLPMPSLSSYNASKFAIRGLSHTLRADLELAGIQDIHVCQVNPSVVDTPAFHHAANYSGRSLKMDIPMATPEQVARAIFDLTKRPKAEVFVGPMAGLGALAYALVPALTRKVLAWGAKRLYFGNRSETRANGNLYAPDAKGPSLSGGWKSGETSQV